MALATAQADAEKQKIQRIISGVYEGQVRGSMVGVSSYLMPQAVADFHRGKDPKKVVEGFISDIKSVFVECKEVLRKSLVEKSFGDWKVAERTFAAYELIQAEGIHDNTEKTTLLARNIIELIELAVRSTLMTGKTPSGEDAERLVKLFQAAFDSGLHARDIMENSCYQLIAERCFALEGMDCVLETLLKKATMEASVDFALKVESIADAARGLARIKALLQGVVLAHGKGKVDREYLTEVVKDTIVTEEMLDLIINWINSPGLLERELSCRDPNALLSDLGANLAKEHLRQPPDSEAGNLDLDDLDRPHEGFTDYTGGMGRGIEN